jgi:hypothetical protein
LGPHTTRDWPHEKSLARGRQDSRNVIRRTEKCLECHLGTFSNATAKQETEKFVDHEMIAAGHPDLYFELDSFSAVMPRHWKAPRELAPGKPIEDPAWAGVRDWGVGQAVQLSAAMERLARRAKKDVWPEYSELSCIACHHALGPAKDSWRQQHGYIGRRPGDPAWNSSRYLVFRVFARQVDSNLAQDLEKRVSAVADEMSKLNPDRNAVAAAASSAVPVAQQFAERLAIMPYASETALRTMRGITQDAQAISLGDERTAEQAAMALDALYIAYSKQMNPPGAPEVRVAINGLFRQLENPSAYNADQFAASLKRINDLLH